MRRHILSTLFNLSCPLQTLNGESQQKADDLQLETSGRHRVDLPRKHRAQVTENRLDVLASGLAQKLLPCRHLSLGSLLALGFEVQADLFEEVLVVVVGVALVGVNDRAFGQI